MLQRLTKILAIAAAAWAAAGCGGGGGDGVQVIASLAGCSDVKGGQYRSIDYGGRTRLWRVDFDAGTLHDAGDSGAALRIGAAQDCAFTASGRLDGADAKFEVAFNASGVGVYRAGEGRMGYIFPASTYTGAKLPEGTWTYLESGKFRDGDAPRHEVGSIRVGSQGAVDFCDPDGQTGCQKFDAPASKGGFQLAGDSKVLYVHRSLQGRLTLFGSTDPEGTRSASVGQTVIVATMQPQDAPATGASSHRSLTLLTDGQGVAVSEFTRQTLTISAIDGKTVSRTRQQGLAATGSTSEQVVVYDSPGAGLNEVSRIDPRGFFIVEDIELPLVGTGVVLAFNRSDSSFSYSARVLLP